MNRPRKKGYKDLPINLYFDKTKKMYRYIHPDTKKPYWMGKDKIKAMDAARILNSILIKEVDLVEKVLEMGVSLKDFTDNRFIAVVLKERLSENKLSKVTYNGYLRQLKHIKNKLGQRVLSSFTVKDIADYLNDLPKINSNRHRSLLVQIFKYARAEGLIDDNPAEQTIKRSEKKKRHKLTLEGYEVIYNHEKTPKWLKNAMKLALKSLQRREDIVNFEKKHLKKETILVDENPVEVEFFYVVQQKTEKHGESAYIKILVGPEFKEAIRECYDDTLSPYLVHRLPKKSYASKVKKHHTQVLPDYLTKEFARIRDLTKFFDDIPPKERPTFHEIRSLGMSEYKKKGIDPQKLAGHMTAEMTKHYLKGHDIVWTEVASF